MKKEEIVALQQWRSSIKAGAPLSDADLATIDILLDHIGSCEEDQLRTLLLDPLEGLEAQKRNADQSRLNTRWLIDIVDQVHALLCPGHIGTWQDRAKKIVAVAKEKVS